MFHFRLFPEKNEKNFFFQKTPLFSAHRAHFWAKQNVPLNSVLISFVFFNLSIIVPNFEGKVMSGFQPTLVSDACMHTCMVQAYDEALHTSYHSDSEILSVKC